MGWGWQKCKKITPGHSRCGILNREKKDIVKLNQALTTNVHSVSEEPKLMKKTNRKPEKDSEELLW